jgi:hypothetical protein
MVAAQTNCSTYVNIVGLSQYNGQCTMFGGQAILSQGLGKCRACLAHLFCIAAPSVRSRSFSPLP